MAGQSPKPTGKAGIGRRLLILIVIAVLLTTALIWMSISLFNATGSLDLDDWGIFAFEFKFLDTMLPRIL